MKPRHMYQWKHLDDERDPPWAVALAGILWAFLAIVMAFL